MDFDTYYIRVIRYLTIRPRSEKEIREYLKKKISNTQSHTVNTPVTQEESSLIDAIIQKIKQQKFINDEEFAKAWIRSRTAFKPEGEKLIRYELQQKGVDKKTVDEAFRSLVTDDDFMGARRDECSLAKGILEKKRKKFEPMEKREQFNKAGSMLARKGFDLSTIKKAIEEVFGK